MSSAEIEKLKILQVVPALSLESGVANYAWNTLRGIGDDALSFDFLYHIDAEHSFHRDAESAGCNIFKAPDAASDPLGYVRYVQELFASHAGEYPIVHCHCPNTAFTVLREASRAGVAGRILHSHQSESSEHFVRRIRNYPLIRYGDRFATKRLACSTEAGISVFGTKEFFVCRNGIDLSKYSYDPVKKAAVRRALNVSQGALVVGCVGRLSKVKNYPFMLRVFQGVRTMQPSAKLLIAGDGPDRAMLERMSSALGIAEDVLFLGVRDDVNELYSAMDVFAMPSLKEGLPISAIEAQAAGLRCVFSEGVPFEADVSGQSRFLPFGESHDDWAATLCAQAVKGRVRDAAERVDSAGFSHIRAAREIGRLYRSLVEEGRSHA